jgi:NADH-ubiquinone oxidoreductase chain 4
MVVMLGYSFLIVSLLYFYIFFEVVLIPIFLLVIGWGYQPERVQAGIYMLFYTLFASLPLLFIILFSYKNFLLIERAEGYYYEGMTGVLITFLFIFAFLVKLPIFCVHL